MVAALAAAEVAGIRVGDIAADRAVRDTLLHLAHGVGETIGLLARRAQDVKRETLRALRADAGQALQFLDQSGEGLGQRQVRTSCRAAASRPSSAPCRRLPCAARR